MSYKLCVFGVEVNYKLLYDFAYCYESAFIGKNVKSSPKLLYGQTLTSKFNNNIHCCEKF